ncbi:MAG: response regulator [Calditrichaeota bacterium]|nr:response regulator [Calditrichota bacterium]
MSAKILICEDERTIHELIRKTLCDGGFNTLSAYTAEEALRLTRDERPQVMLLDMMLPDGSGEQVLATLNEWGEDALPRIIVLSAVPRHEVEAQLINYSISDVITKPFQPDALLQSVRRVVQSLFRSSAEQPLILVVEDSHVHQRVVGRFLESNGFQPIFAETVEEALKFVSTFLPQAIILDLHLPKVSGLGLLEELKARKESIPVIVTSGVIDKKILQRLSAYEVKAVLTKPISIPLLQERLDEIFANSPGILRRKKTAVREAQVLLVEDFLLTLRMTESALTNMGFHVISARDGGSALALLSSNPIDLIVLDVALPGMNGLEFLETIRRSGNRIPCIVVSGNLDEKKQLELKQLGVKKFFSKPLALDEFAAYVDGFLRDVDPSFSHGCPYEVLIALNSDHAAHLAEETLRAKGHTTQVVNDGFLAVAELRRGPKIFVFDADLAGVDGPELARRAGPPERRCTRLLALAEYLDDEMEKELMKLGIDAALRKPFHREELAQKVSELLAGSAVQVPVSDFLDSFQAHLRELPKATDVSYWTQLSMLGHNLQGTAAYINRPDLALLGQQLEESAKQRDAAMAAEYVEQLWQLLRDIGQDSTLAVGEKVAAL